MKIHSSPRLSPEAKARWIDALPKTSAGSAGIDLCEALQDSSSPVSVCYLEAVSDDGQPLALGLVHTIHGLDIGSYLGGVAQRVFTSIGTLGWRPLSMDVTFIEIPFCNLPGLCFTSEGERREAEVVREMIGFARATLPCDIFCVKSYDGSPSEQSFAGLGMMNTSFPANTALALPFSTFDEYLHCLPADWRSIVRRNRKRFAASKGKVIHVTDLVSAAPGTAELFHSTTAFHVAKGDMGRPLDIDRKFLECLGRNAKPANRFLLTCEVDGQPAITSLMLRSGKQLIAVKAGLNYDLARSSKAYFNSYYAMIEFAIEQRLEFIQLCAEAYEVKRYLGGTTAPVSYYFEINNRWIAPIVKLAAKHFSGQKGAGAAAAEA
jgi:hypothetical protein